MGRAASSQRRQEDRAAEAPDRRDHNASLLNVRSHVRCVGWIRRLCTLGHLGHLERSPTTNRDRSNETGGRHDNVRSGGVHGDTARQRQPLSQAIITRRLTCLRPATSSRSPRRARLPPKRGKQHEQVPAAVASAWLRSSVSSRRVAEAGEEFLKAAEKLKPNVASPLCRKSIAARGTRYWPDFKRGRTEQLDRSRGRI
jgi:hypothetical protein